MIGLPTLSSLDRSASTRIWLATLIGRLADWLPDVWKRRNPAIAG